MKKKLVIGFLFYILFIVIIVNYYNPKSINVTYKGIKYRLEEGSYQEHIEVKIEGKYFKKDKRYEGKIYINEYVLYSLVLKFDENNIARLKSIAPSFSPIDAKVYIDDDFKKIVIYFEEGVIGDWKIKNDLLISAPAHNRDEEIEMIKELIGDFSY